MSSNLIVWNNGAVIGPWEDGLMTPSNNSLLTPTQKSAYLFDVRVMNKAVSESGGKAVGNNLGTVSYIYDDMLNNNGKVHLPFG